MSLATVPRPQVKFQAFAEPVHDELVGGQVPIGLLSTSHVRVAGALVVVTSKLVEVVALLVMAGHVVEQTVGVRIDERRDGRQAAGDAHGDVDDLLHLARTALRPPGDRDRHVLVVGGLRVGRVRRGRQRAVVGRVAGRARPRAVAGSSVVQTVATTVYV